MKKWFIVRIDFNSNLYNEHGFLVYKVHAEDREQAYEFTQEYIKKEKAKDHHYSYSICAIYDFEEMAEISIKK